VPFSVNMCSPEGMAWNGRTNARVFKMALHLRISLTTARMTVDQIMSLVGTAPCGGKHVVKATGFKCSRVPTVLVPIVLAWNGRAKHTVGRNRHILQYNPSNAAPDSARPFEEH